ncbi:hypothetical protein CDL15_Pgr026014 [Punica granatum]|uniref:Uncharacterized protein n=1 Tax=Punica granatum TaxID=22663 RepID=A0A218WBB6_PUNGR|nr:hypothetical protein CDL15_Pgr026014 [Punica granatum]
MQGIIWKPRAEQHMTESKQQREARRVAAPSFLQFRFWSSGINTAEGDGDSIGVGPRGVEGGDAADFAEGVLGGVSAEGVGSEELLGIGGELKSREGTIEASVASHGAVGAVAPPGNDAGRGFHFPSHTAAVAMASSPMHHFLRSLRSHSCSVMGYYWYSDSSICLPAGSCRRKHVKTPFPCPSLSLGPDLNDQSYVR